MHKKLSPQLTRYPERAHLSDTVYADRKS